MLREYVETLLDKERIDIFIDELPWLDTPRSRFLKAFDLFWNGWASARKDILHSMTHSVEMWIFFSFALLLFVYQYIPDIIATIIELNG